MDGPPAKRVRVDDVGLNGCQYLSRLALPPALYRCAFPRYQCPHEAGVFSLDEQRQWRDDASQRRHYIRLDPSTSTLDLREGYGRFVARDEDRREGLDHLLRWIGAHRPKPADVVTWRGHLSKILCTPFDRKSPWRLAAQMHRGSIYLSEWELPEVRAERLHRQPRQQEMCYWGYRFEAYATDPANPVPVVNSNAAFCMVVQSKLGSHSLLFGGEVDCEDQAGYVELKTSALMTTARQQQLFERHKLLKWWAQSFLPNVGLAFLFYFVFFAPMLFFARQKQHEFLERK